jgi:hypothetical protein
MAAISTVQIDIADFLLTVLETPQEARGEWLTQFARSLAKRDLEGHPYARKALLEAIRRGDPERRVPGYLRDAVFQRDGYACTYCGDLSGPFHCDHVIPYSRGGATILSNLTTACAPCNLSKHARTPEEWRAA